MQNYILKTSGSLFTQLKDGSKKEIAANLISSLCRSSLI